jgi:integrase
MGLRKLGPKQWLVCVVVRDPKTGKRRERKRKCSGTELDAHVFEEELRQELLGGAATRMTLGAFATSWLARRAASLKPSTVAKYGNDLDRHILPALGDYYLDQIRPSDVQDFLADHGAGWSVTNRLRLLRTIAKDALADRLAEIDFCARVKAPAVEGWTEDEPGLLSAEDMGKVIAATPEAWRPLVTLMALTGMRWGEASALRWEDIGEGVARIRRSNWKGRVQRPKTRRAARTVPLSGPVMDALRAHRRRLLAEQHPGLAAGLVFPAASGELHRGTPLNKVLTAACKAAGVDRITPHGLRRTSNDLLRRVASGIVTRAIIGHADEGMTEWYSAVDAKEKGEAAESVAALILGDLRAAQVDESVEAKEGGIS